MAVGNAITNATGPAFPLRNDFPDANRPIVSAQAPPANTVRYIMSRRPSSERPNAEVKQTVATQCIPEVNGEGIASAAALVAVMTESLGNLLAIPYKRWPP
jgi:hypothetical protein